MGVSSGGGGGWLQYIRRNERFFFNQVSSIADIIHIVCIKKRMIITHLINLIMHRVRHIDNIYLLY